jgi:hypothetical protein
MYACGKSKCHKTPNLTLTRSEISQT